MKKTLLVILVTATLLPFYGYAQMEKQRGKGKVGGCMMNMSMIRHHYVMQNGIDNKYADKSNPLSGTSTDIEQGSELYAQNCASCHGASGRGDGEAGKALNIRPVNIARFSKMPMASDAYLYWTISEGGVPVKSAMPPMKSALSEQEIWKIITYLRQL